MLRHIQNVVLPGIARIYQMDPTLLLAYVHYHPSSWVFHVHIMASTHYGLAESSASGLGRTIFLRWHALSTIVAILEGNGRYYTDATLAIIITEKQAEYYEQPPPELVIKQ